MNNTITDILNEIEKTHGLKLRLRIENLPIEEKLVAMFIAMSSKKDKNLVNLVKELKTSNNIITQLDKIIERIRKYLDISELEKKSFGEVFTPFKLINEMLDTLPIHIWTNPNLKWADLCNGVGNFMIIVIKRLMIGLESWESNEFKRYKHIIQNMIYVAELQPKNMFLWMLSIDPKSKLNLNLYTGNSLSKEFDEHMKNVWNVEKFDIIVGNPPYQEQKEGNKKTQPMWHLFVNRYISLLTNNGYLNIVHPSGWRNVDGVFKKTQNLLKSKQILFLKMHSFKQGQDTFNAAINFDYYCLKNVSNNKETKIICEDNTEYSINISNKDFIPSENIEEIYSLVAKNGEETVKILHSYSDYEHRKPFLSKEKKIGFDYLCVYTVKSPDKNNIPTVYYSSLNNRGHFNIPKVIFANGASGVFIDYNGDYALTEFAQAIIDEKSNLENIKKALQSEKFVKKIMLFKNSLGNKYNRKIIETFRKDFWKEFIN